VPRPPLWTTAYPYEASAEVAECARLGDARLESDHTASRPRLAHRARFRSRAARSFSTITRLSNSLTAPSTCRIGRRLGSSPPSAVRPAGNIGCGEPKIPALETRISLSDKPGDRDRRRYEPVRADSIKAMSHGLHERAGYITATVFAIAHEVALATEGQTIHLSTSNAKALLDGGSVQRRCYRRSEST